MWYYEDNGQPAGPFTEEELNARARSRVITPETLFWKEGLPNWISAREAGLGVRFPEEPPVAETAPPKSDEPKRAKLSQTTLILCSAIGSVLGYGIVRALPPSVTIRIASGTIAGLLCGLIPYFVGKGKDPKMARNVLCGLAGAGAAFGLLLAFPLAIVFTILLALKPQRENG
jgi:hypothetical protein